MDHRKTVRSIQILRAIAVILILFASVENTESLEPLGEPPLRNLSPCWMGIDLLYIISGFVITNATLDQNGGRQALSFLWRRFIRINPLYYIASSICFAILYFNGSFERQWLNFLNSAADTILILPTSKDIRLYRPFLVQGWMLSFIWIFYLIVGLFIAMRMRNKAKYQLFFIPSLVVIGYILNSDDGTINSLSNPMLIEFCFGVFISMCYNSLQWVPKRNNEIIVVAGVVSFILVIVFISFDIWYYKNVFRGQLSTQRLIYGGIPSSLIVAGCVFMEKRGRLNKFWNNKILSLIGRASFSICLIHLPVLQLSSELTRKIPSPSYWYYALVVIVAAICIVTGLIFNKIFEMPLLQSHRKGNLSGILNANFMSFKNI